MNKTRAFLTAKTATLINSARDFVIVTLILLKTLNSNFKIERFFFERFE